MTIFKFKDYKLALKQILTYKKVAAKLPLTFEEMANYCRVQKTYLSKVLNRDGNLSRDQVYRAGQYLQLKNNELQYLIQIYDYQYSDDQSFKKEMLKRIEAVQLEQELTEKNINVKSEQAQAQDLSAYYLNAYLPILHMFLTIDRYAKNTDLILRELNIDQKLFAELIDRLVNLKIIEYQEKRWQIKLDNIHLSKTSDVYPIYRNQMRIKALEKMDRLHADDFYSFSALFSTEKDVADQIKSNFMEFLKKTQKLVEGGKMENVYQINFDLLPWCGKI